MIEAKESEVGLTTCAQFADTLNYDIIIERVIEPYLGLVEIFNRKREFAGQSHLSRR